MLLTKAYGMACQRRNNKQLFFMAISYNRKPHVTVLSDFFFLLVPIKVSVVVKYDKPASGIMPFISRNNDRM